MTSIDSQKTSRSLAQTLAVQTQVHLPGTAGRLLKQIRDLERIAPVFLEAGLVRPIDRPNPLNASVAGIATKAAAKRVAGGFLYAAAACRTDISVRDNVVSTRAEDSRCEVDDIDYEDQSKRFQLIGVRQAYELADRALRSSEQYDLILFDCPLLLNRSMVAPQYSDRYSTYRGLYKTTIEYICQFWNEHRERLFPWNREGPILVGLASERFGAVVQLSQQDLRTSDGRKHVLSTDEPNCEVLEKLADARTAISSIGERRFIRGILGNYTRTVAFRMNVQTPRMEPEEVADLGAVGLHYSSAPGTLPRLVQLVGDEPGWDRRLLDELSGMLMALTVLGGKRAFPLPIELAMRELTSLENFLDYYRRGLYTEMRERNIEDVWLSELNDLNEDGDKP